MSELQKIAKAYKKWVEAQHKAFQEFIQEHGPGVYNKTDVSFEAFLADLTEGE